jgi:hypothetical protein
MILKIILLSLIATASNDTPIVPLTEKIIKEMKKSGPYKSFCPVRPDNLRLVSVSYHDFQGAVKTGEIIEWKSKKDYHHFEKVLKNSRSE